MYFVAINMFTKTASIIHQWNYYWKFVTLEAKTHILYMFCLANTRCCLWYTKPYAFINTFIRNKFAKHNNM
jgi:hypothetical protein